MPRLLACLCAALWFSACASDSRDADAIDLPPGWEAAERIEELMQMPCGGSALTDSGDSADWNTTADGVSVHYDRAHFRCVQEVEGFVKRGNDALDVLVQPVDMSPQAVAGCDCLYKISMVVPAPKGHYQFTLYRRWDSANKPNDPVKIGGSEVTIE